MHLETLTEEAKLLLPSLKSFDPYCLAGGTAIALQIGHRVSVDFDFFSDSEIPSDLLSKLKKRLPESTEVKPSTNNSEELTVFANNTKITFLHYPFPVIDKVIEIDNLKLLSLQELAATKAYTVGRRGEYKDYIDLYYLLSDHISLNEVVETAKKKYQNDFNDRLFMEQLIYLDDIADASIALLKDDKLDKAILREFFEAKIAQVSI